MTKDEALKLALEALEANQPVNYCMNNNGEKFPMMQEDPFRFERNTKAITAIKEALAQPEQEYHAVNAVHKGQQCYVKAQPEQPKVRTGNCLRVGVCASEGHKIQPQRTWVGLTDEEIADLWSAQIFHINDLKLAKDFVRDIEAKLNEKNT